VTGRRLIAAGALVLASVNPAHAQGPARGTVEISGGAELAAGYDLGRRTAVLTSNTGTTGGTFDFFDVKGRVKTSYGLLARLGVYVTPLFAVEGGVHWLRPVLAQAITGDTEGAPNTTAEETLDQYVFEGSAVWHLGRGRTVPFVYGGAGYMRQLHEGDALLEEGAEIHAGFGLKWRFGKRFGIRGDAGISIRPGSTDEESKRRSIPTAAGSMIWVF
jgi:outer membrane protein with beta-barrel domain